MPAFVHFFGISPSDYWHLTLPEYIEMRAYIVTRLKAEDTDGR